jgi:hypothetical protein
MSVNILQVTNQISLTHLSHGLDLVEPRVSAQHLPGEMFLLFVYHDGEKLIGLQSRVQESLLDFAGLDSLLVFVSHPLVLRFFWRRNIISELLSGGLGHPNLEAHPHQKGGCSSDRIQPSLSDQTGS